MGWIAFWTTLVIVNVATLINHISNGTVPWFSIAGLCLAAISLGYNVGRWINEQG